MRPFRRIPSLFGLLLFFCISFFPPDMSGDVKKKFNLKVLSYNIHHASPPSTPGVTDLDAIAKVINAQQPDLVALQEVDVNTQRSGPYNQAVELGKKTGLTAHFFRSINYDGGEYGLAILSRLPVTETNLYPLPRLEGNGGEPRILATATIQLHAKAQLLFACTQLDSRRDSLNRRLQMDAIVGLLKDNTLPAIIAGDFNADPNSEVIGILDSHFTRTCHPCDFTFPAANPVKAIDFIAYSHSDIIRMKSHRVIPETYASNHSAVSAEFEIRL